MQLDLQTLTKEVVNSKFVKNFIKELGETLMNTNNNDLSQDLTDDELREYDRESFKFLEKFFKDALSNTSNGETFIVHLKYDNDPDNRYKVAQYKDGFENLYITHKQNLPDDVVIGDVVVKKDDGNYYHDYEATNFVKEQLNEIKQKIINKR